MLQLLQKPSRFFFKKNHSAAVERTLSQLHTIVHQYHTNPGFRVDPAVIESRSEDFFSSEFRLWIPVCMNTISGLSLSVCLCHFFFFFFYSFCEWAVYFNRRDVAVAGESVPVAEWSVPVAGTAVHIARCTAKMSLSICTYVNSCTG